VRRKLQNLLFHPLTGLIVLVILIFATTLLIPREGLNDPSPQNSTPTVEIKTVPVIVAVQPISRHTRITYNSIGVRQWPEYVDPPPELVNNMNDAVGKLVKTDIVQGQPIVYSMFTNTHKWGLSAYPAVSKEMIFYHVEENLYAISAKTGQAVWHFEPEGDRLLEASPPIATDGLVYYSVAKLDRSQDNPENSFHSTLYAIDTETGKVNWQFTEAVTEIEYSSPPIPPLVDQSMVYFVSWDHKSLFALEGQTGEEKWRIKTESLISYPVVKDGIIAFATADGYLYNVDVETGQQRWRVKQ
jgi:outer membrane protein assembly factor BamB